jgi:nucleoside-triphosphatase THEP1
MLILSGEKGAGKTTLIRDIIQENKIHAQGFLSVKEMTGKEVTGISLLLLPEWRKIPMATTTPIATDVSTPRFYFYPDVFHKVNGRFLGLVPGVPFVFDEYGPLEKEGRGHCPVFRTLIQLSHPSLIVVRRKLAHDLSSALGSTCRKKILDMTVSDLSPLRARITSFLQDLKG